MKTHVLKMTLLRHGRSRADDEGVHEGRYDSPLTELGRIQSSALAEYWIANPPNFDKVYCSSLCRASQTAEIVAQSLDLPLYNSELLCEWDNGPLAGMQRLAALSKYPIPDFRHDFSNYTCDGGESQAAIRARALLALEMLWQDGASNLLVVSHGGFMNTLLREIFKSERAYFPFGDTTFTTLILSRDSHDVWLTGVGLRPHWDIRLEPPTA